MSTRTAVLTLLTCVTFTVSTPVHAQRTAAQAAPQKRPLLAADIDDIAALLKLEDTRQFDAEALMRVLASKHPEVRRRAITTIGRLANEQGRALLTALHDEKDPELLATVAFATGQLKDTTSIAWLSSLLANPRAASVARKEAAQALGKLAPAAATPSAPLPADARAAHDALAQFLKTAPPSTAPNVVGEALFSIGRFATIEDIAPIVRWATHRDAEIRWHAAWALFRPRNPAAAPTLLTLSTDTSADVRFWAVRGLTAAVVSQSTVPLAVASARLRQAANDPDRRVRTEAIRSLTAFDASLPAARYDDDASFDVVLSALQSKDTWLSVSAVENIHRYTSRAASATAAVIAATRTGQPTSLRIAALAPLEALNADAARALATELSNAATSGTTPSGASGAAGTTARDSAAATIRRLDAAAARAAQAASGQAPTATGRQGGGGGRGGAARPPLVARPDAEYRELVTRWIVPDYNGAAKPHVIFGTPRGDVDIELYPGDAPFGVEYLFKVVESGEIVNTEFSRVVPNFVAQEGPIRAQGTLRDEVNRRGLTRGNLSWASAGLDTGRPGYTLGSTPQPHNEGGFTSLGRVVKGIDAVDRLELGDKITTARIWRR